MKKTYLVLSLLAGGLIVGGVSGCGGPTRSGPTVTVWHTWGQANRRMIELMIEDFYEEHPNVNISLVNKSDYDQIHDDISKSFPANTTPTMAICYPDHVADYEGFVIDLTSYINSTEEFDGEVLGFEASEGSHEENGVTLSGVDDYVDAYWEEGSQYAFDPDGIYSVPFSKSTEVMFYNKTFFEANKLTPPTIWDNPDNPNDPNSFTYVARTIRDIVINQQGQQWGGDKNGIRALGYDSDDNLYITFSEQLGIPYTSMDENEHYPFGANGGNSQAKDMVRTVKSWYDNGYIATGGTSGGSYTSTLFTDEMIYMSIGSTGGTRYNVSSNFEVGVAKVPQWNPETPKTMSQGPSFCFFNTADEDQLKYGWLFYKHITNYVNTAKYAMNTGYSPVRISSYQDVAYGNHLNNIGEDGVEYAVNSENWLQSKVHNIVATMDNDYFTSPVFKGSAQARVAVGSIITNVLTGVQDVDTAFSVAYASCQLYS